MEITKSLSILVGATLLSSFLGYARDAALATKFGASTATDAFFAAFFVPDTLYLILVAGSTSAVFIPVFIEYLEKDREEAWYVASCVFNVSALVLGIVVLVGVLTVRNWIPLLFPGYDESIRALSIELSLLLLPMLLFIGLSNLFTAALNSLEHFTVPALAPVISNVIVIAAIIFSGYLGGIHGVAVVVPIGMVFQSLVQLPVLVRLGARYRPVLNLWHPALRRVGKLAVPLIAYLAVAYASLVLERMLASTLSTGTVSAFNYAMRLFVLPVRSFGGTIGTVLYPRLSRQAASNDKQALTESLSKAIGVAVFLLLPKSIWLVINSEFLVSLVYGHGRFTPKDVHLTAIILGGYAIGLMPRGITGLLQRGFYALQDTVTPLLIEVFTLVMYVGGATGLTYAFGPVGLASARGLSFIIVVVISVWAFHRFHQTLVDRKRLLFLFGRYLLAGLFAAAIWSSPLWLGSKVNLGGIGKQGDILITATCGIVGLAVYVFCLSDLGGARSVGNLLRFLTNRAKASHRNID